MDVRVGPQRRLSTKESMLLNCGVGEDSWDWTERRLDQSILKEINPGYSLEGLMLKLKLQYLGHLMQTANSLENLSYAGKDWRQEEKEMIEDEMVGWHHGINRHGFEHALRDGEGQGSLVRCSPWSCKESDMTKQLNNNNTVLQDI